VLSGVFARRRNDSGSEVDGSIVYNFFFMNLQMQKKILH